MNRGPHVCSVLSTPRIPWPVPSAVAHVLLPGHLLYLPHVRLPLKNRAQDREAKTGIESAIKLGWGRDKIITSHTHLIGSLTHFPKSSQRPDHGRRRYYQPLLGRKNSSERWVQTRSVHLAERSHSGESGGLKEVGAQGRGTPCRWL